MKTTTQTVAEFDAFRQFKSEVLQALCQLGIPSVAAEASILSVGANCLEVYRNQSMGPRVAALKIRKRYFEDLQQAKLQEKINADQKNDLERRTALNQFLIFHIKDIIRFYGFSVDSTTIADLLTLLEHGESQ